MENQNEKPTRTYNFFKPIGQFIEHVDTVNFTLDGNGEFHFESAGQMNGLLKDAEPQPAAQPVAQKKMASKEMMSRAMINTLHDGYWKSGRGWNIVYVLYQIWGYKGAVNDFLEEVVTWPDVGRNRYVCNRDAVTKLGYKYNFSKDITKWRGDGVPEAYCKLGEQLNEELEKMWAQKGA